MIQTTMASNNAAGMSDIAMHTNEDGVHQTECVTHAMSNESELHIVYDGTDRCVYDFKYKDGVVTLSNMYDTKIQFVIQRCNWGVVQRMFAQIDGNIRRGELGYEYEVIKREVLYGYRSPSSHNFVYAHTDLHESKVKRRINFF